MTRARRSRTRRKFKGLKESGEKSDTKWFAFPIIGYLMIFFLAWLGSALLFSGAFIGLGIAAIMTVSYFYITQFLEQARIDGGNQTLLWITFVVIALIFSSLGHHYLYVFHSDKSEYLNERKANIQEKIDLINEYEKLTKQLVELKTCDVSTFENDTPILHSELEYYRSNIENIGNPIDFLVNLNKSNSERTHQDIKSDIDASLEKYKSLNDGSCINVDLSVGDLSTQKDIHRTKRNSISNSLAQANWFLFLGLLIISSFLILVPYFIAESATDILKPR